MLSLEKFHFGENLHSRYGALRTLLCAGAGYLIVVYGLDWLLRHIPGAMVALVCLAAVVVLAILAFNVFMGSIAIKNQSIQQLYGVLIGYLLASEFSYGWRDTPNFWLWLVIGGGAGYLLLFLINKKSSLIAAGQCLLGTLAGVWLLSHYINVAVDLLSF
ncbi:hypothetical protein [Gallaecimonas mangrovi]|uniref:hypothetical protein n=1 Tax=Gallaecimonas mangrovi TaxID=2291597 RepID=UPI000E20C270|nr:hypothetical protein [Gallaecimonas mangrovi]